MPTRNWEKLSSSVRKAIRLTLNDIGRTAVKDIRQSISIRVQYVPGFGYIRSEPGEPPRRDKSLLWRSIKYKVAAQAVSVEALSIYVDEAAYYAWYLEEGTSNMEARPFWAPAKRRMGNLKRLFETNLAERLRQAYESGLYENIPVSQDTSYDLDS